MGEIEIIYALQGAGEGWITFFRIFTLLGSWLGFAVALMPLFFKDRKLSFAYVATFVFSVLFNLALKAIIARPRPFDSFEDVINYAGADGYSMPSSHAMCGAIIATFLIYFLLKFNLPASLMPVCLSASSTAMLLLSIFAITTTLKKPLAKGFVLKYIKHLV